MTPPAGQKSVEEQYLTSLQQENEQLRDKNQDYLEETGRLHEENEQLNALIDEMVAEVIDLKTFIPKDMPLSRKRTEERLTGWQAQRKEHGT